MLVKRRSNNRPKIGVIAILALILTGAGYVVLYSPVFKISAVNVTITEFDESKLRGLIGPDPRGENLIFWSPVNADKQYPEIKDLQITKDYLHRTIEITGSIRDKKIVWCFRSADANCFWVDGTGYIFVESPKIEGAALRVVNDDRSIPLDVGEIVLSSKMFTNLNSILDILTEFNLPIKDISIEDIKLREFVVRVESGPKMTFSLETNPGFIKPALNSMIKSPSWDRTTTVNFTVEGRVYQGF